MQQFGTPPKRTATKRTFTLTNYYQPLYLALDNRIEEMKCHILEYIDGGLAEEYKNQGYPRHCSP